MRNNSNNYDAILDYMYKEIKRAVSLPDIKATYS
jgi:uncharacterized membrane protein